MRLTGVIGALVLAATAVADEGESRRAEVRLDSGWVANQGDERSVIYGGTVSVPGVVWLRVDFDEATLGEAPAGGDSTVLRLTSMADGAEQRLRQVHIEQWQRSSAYFVGGDVLVEIIADPGAAPSRVSVSSVLVSAASVMDSICGPTDDRQLSMDPRVARGWTSGGSANCTAWLIQDCAKCMLAAGHCGFGGGQVHFNSPLSTPGGTPVPPHPDHQYAVDQASRQSVNGGVGNDYFYFGTFPNPNTGLTPFEAQGAAFFLGDTPLPGDMIRITGYGVTNSPVDPSWHRAQKTHVGPFVGLSGTRLQYATDTTSGNSGSPVINERTGEAVGIHTHGGCNSGGGSNSGTSLLNAGLQAAMSAPQGVCDMACCYADCTQSTGVGVLDIFDFICFQDRFAVADPYACDCSTGTGAGVCDIFDFVCFQDAFVAGCP